MERARDIVNSVASKVQTFFSCNCELHIYVLYLIIVNMLLVRGIGNLIELKVCNFLCVYQFDVEGLKSCHLVLDF